MRSSPMRSSGRDHTLSKAALRKWLYKVSSVLAHRAPPTRLLVRLSASPHPEPDATSPHSASAPSLIQPVVSSLVLSCPRHGVPAPSTGHLQDCPLSCQVKCRFPGPACAGRGPDPGQFTSSPGNSQQGPQSLACGPENIPAAQDPAPLPSWDP